MEKVEKNPSSGLMSRNPSHVFEADKAQFQSDIVKQMKKSGIGRDQIIWDYGEEKLHPMSGILKIREMDEEDTVKFGMTLFRTKPNIFKIHLVLGDYQNKRQIRGSKIRDLESNIQRYPRDIGESFGRVLGDSSLNVVEIIYEITSTEPYRTEATVYGVTDEEYNDDTKFRPAIKIDFMKTA